MHMSMCPKTGKTWNQFYFCHVDTLDLRIALRKERKKRAKSSNGDKGSHQNGAHVLFFPLPPLEKLTWLAGKSTKIWRCIECLLKMFFFGFTMLVFSGMYPGHLKLHLYWSPLQPTNQPLSDCSWPRQSSAEVVAFGQVHVLRENISWGKPRAFPRWERFFPRNFLLLRFYMVPQPQADSCEKVPGIKRSWTIFQLGRSKGEVE